MKPDSTLSAKRYRFGVFEVDLRSGEVRKAGIRIRVQGQPFEVLAILLTKPGEVVTREGLQKRLWPTDTFVDFDHGVNTAINKLRVALSDTADTPRYIETLPRRGYRFIAPVELAASVEPEIARVSPNIIESVNDRTLSGHGSDPRRRFNLALLTVLVTVVLSTVTGLLAYSFRKHTTN